MSIEDIVNVQITRDTRSVSRKGFGVTLVMGVDKAFTSLTRTYSKQNDVLVDFNATDKEAVASASLFAQSPSPIQVVIGRRATTDDTIVTVTSLSAITVYTCVLNGQLVTFTSTASDSAIVITAGLKTAFDLLSGTDVLFVDNLDGTYTVSPTVATTAYSIKVNANQATAFVLVNAAIATDISNIQNENNVWYGSLYTIRAVEADILAMAVYMETQKQIFGTATSDTDIIDVVAASDTDSLAAQFKSLGLARSWVQYGSGAGKATETVGPFQYPEAALLGTILPLDPGSYTAANQDLSTITVDNLTPTQRTNALAKNAMIYTEVGGANITEEGKVAAGEFIDIIVFVDWIAARITEGVFQLLVSLPKIPFTDAGIATVEAAIDGVLKDGIDLGGISLTPAFTIFVPLAADVSAVDKANRTLNGVTFQATLTGAIHVIQIFGTVSL